MTEEAQLPEFLGSQKNIRWSAELITFFNTEYWGLDKGIPWDEWARAFEAEPQRFFSTMLDRIADTRSAGIELGPAPGGWENAAATFGGADGFRKELTSRHLVLSSSYSPGSLIERGLDDPSSEAAVDDHIAAHAAFVRQVGGDIIVLGNLPRSRFLSDIEEDLPTEDVEAVAQQINRLGAVTESEGVRLALHTDAYGTCARNRDIDTLLGQTDPRRVFLCLDSGHITLDGGDAVEVLRSHTDRVPLMHWKDCIAPLPGGSLQGNVMERHEVMLTYFRILGGGGLVDWPTWMEILRSAQWQGWAVNEVDMSPAPQDEIEAGLSYFESKLAPIYS